MKKPITVTVTREHSNTGDVFLNVFGADGEAVEARLVDTGSETYGALAKQKQLIEDAFNHVEPAEVKVGKKAAKKVAAKKAKKGSRR